MAIPTAKEIRDFLEGYEITIPVLSDEWINKRTTNFIVPFVERVIKSKIASLDEYEEYLSGTGQEILILSRKPIVEVISISYVRRLDYPHIISLAGITILKDEGILKTIPNLIEGNYSSVFAKGHKNIKVVYTAGYEAVPIELHEAILYLSSEQILGFIGARTGGGSLSVQGFSRNFGQRGKYQDIRNDLSRQANILLAKYKTGIIGR